MRNCDGSETQLLAQATFNTMPGKAVHSLSLEESRKELDAKVSETVILVLDCREPREVIVKKQKPN